MVTAEDIDNTEGLTHKSRKLFKLLLEMPEEEQEYWCRRYIAYIDYYKRHGELPVANE